MKVVAGMSVPKNATHAARGRVSGVYAKVGGVWLFAGSRGSGDFHDFNVKDIRMFIGDNKIVECK